MWHRFCIAGACLCLSCASTVQTTEAGALDVMEMDMPPSPDLTAPDRIGERSETAQDAADAGRAEVSIDREDAGPDVREAGYFDDVEIQFVECNDLLPTPPIRTVMRDDELPSTLSGGTIRDGLYRMVAFEVYRHGPEHAPRAAWAGFTLRILGNRWQWARTISTNPEVRPSFVQRLNCTFSSSSPAQRPLCIFSCPRESAGITAFDEYEVRGNQLVLHGGVELTILERVGDP